TGDERWLERARAFAVHALEQVERERAEHGAGRYSLWTGDIGAAVMAQSCIDARPGMPTLDWVSPTRCNGRKRSDRHASSTETWLPGRQPNGAMPSRHASRDRSDGVPALRL